jgi:hypothetical protein
MIISCLNGMRRKSRRAITRGRAKKQVFNGTLHLCFDKPQDYGADDWCDSAFFDPDTGAIVVFPFFFSTLPFEEAFAELLKLLQHEMCHQAIHSLSEDKAETFYSSRAEEEAITLMTESEEKCPPR